MNKWCTTLNLDQSICNFSFGNYFQKQHPPKILILKNVYIYCLVCVIKTTWILNFHCWALEIVYNFGESVSSA